jgi:polyhydroxybutyrate depolymerase
MKKRKKTFMIIAYSIVGLMAIIAALFLFYVYAPTPKEPLLISVSHRNSLMSGGKLRTYLSYHPKTVKPKPALLIVLHGTNIDGAKVREWTGYEFDQMADKYGFMVAYPDGYEKDWNDCRKGQFSKAKKENIDDVGFIKALISDYRNKFNVEPSEVFLFGYSSGGNMSFRIGIEEEGLIAGIATVSASLPTPETCNCDLNSKTPKIMLVNGTGDRICPYNGGELNLFGTKKGFAIAAQATAENFAKRNGISAISQKNHFTHLHADDQTSVERQVWTKNGESFVELLTVNGGGHVIPQQLAKFPRIMGKVTGDLDAPKEAIAFFSLERNE